MGSWAMTLPCFAFLSRKNEVVRPEAAEAQAGGKEVEATEAPSKQETLEEEEGAGTVLLGLNTTFQVFTKAAHQRATIQTLMA